MTRQMSFEGLVLVGTASESFADFYRDHIRPQQGARLGAAELRERYAAWAEEAGQPVASARAISSFMQANGHTQSKSSLIYYRDAVLGDFAGQPLPARSLPVRDGRPVREAIDVTIDDLDQLLGELNSVRRRLARLSSAIGGAGGRAR